MLPGYLWRAVATTFAAVSLLGGCAEMATATTLPSGFTMTTVAQGLTAPTAVDWTPDGSMLIAEKPGRIKVIPVGGDTTSTLLDISDHVNDYWDRGLEDLAVDSHFASNHYVYLLYVYEPPPKLDYTGAKASRLTRITLNSDGSVVNPASPETVLLGKDSDAPCGPASNTLDCSPADGRSHSVGSVRSAADGTLFVGAGDAAGFVGAGAAAFRTYDEHSLAGKIVHIDRDGNGLPGHPFCSDDTNLDHVCAKLHAKGFRNPFRFSLRPDGDVIVGDVGWNALEEIDLLRPGGNYGWPCYEAGSHNGPYESLLDTDGSTPCSSLYALEGGPGATDAPIYEYSHDNRPSAIVVGPTYLGGAYPSAYDGDVFFGDFAIGFIKRLQLDDSGAVSGVEEFAEDLYGFVDLELSPRGNLTLVEFGDELNPDGTGSVVEISHGQPPVEAKATPVDSLGPALGISGKRRTGRLRRLSGSVSDSSGVTGVDVALLKHLGKGDCAWLTPVRRRGVLRRGACTAPVWNAAKLTAGKNGWRWSKSLEPALVAPGSYAVLVRGRDPFGNNSSLTARRRVRALR